MTLAEWTAIVIAEVRAAGFECDEYEGFPLAPRPHTRADSVRLIKLDLSLRADRHIYAEGMLFTPAGLPVAEREQV